MFNSSSLLSNISDGMAIVSDAIRSVNHAMNGQPNMGYCNTGIDMNMSRRDLPCYQNPMYNSNAGIPNQYCNNPYPLPVYGYPNGYAQPMMSYIPGKTDPRYGMAPSIYDNRGPMNYNPPYMTTPNTGSMTNGYFSMQTYTSPFMNQNTTMYGYPYGGKYGY